MSTILPALMDTVLGHIAVLFLGAANGNTPLARATAAQMLAAYDPKTPDELCLAAQIICFNLQALDALSQAANPDNSLNNVLRLRSSAVSLSRQAEAAERRLAHLRNGRAPQPEAASEPAEVASPKSAETSPATIPAATKNHQKLQAARRIAEIFKKNQAAHLAAAGA
jgi:hypothetical protein